MDDRWERNSEGRLSLEDSITGIATNNSMVILKHAEQDPVYAPLLRAFLSRVVDLAGDVMRQDIVVGEVLILLSSPDRVTPYHMDAEVNYLVQVTGNKTVRVYDQTDRALVTHEERERYFAGDYNSAPYREGKLDQASVFELNAGCGVHIPVFAPHWVQTHSNVSVALSVNYELRSVKRLERIYHTNRLLRRVKLSPVAPGKSRWGDEAKLASVAWLGGGAPVAATSGANASEVGRRRANPAALEPKDEAVAASPALWRSPARLAGGRTSQASFRLLAAALPRSVTTS